MREVDAVDETVLISGCSRGIGLALAREFAGSGRLVFAGARDPGCAALADASRECSRIVPVELDVLSDASVERAAAVVGERAGRLDVLVNNAAIFPGEGHERLAGLDLAWFGEAFETNVTGVARLTRAFAGLLARSARPRVANISSGAGSIGGKDDFAYYPYSVSKAALNMLTRCIANEFAAAGVTVAAISPGWVKTEMGGSGATLTPEESAASLASTISRLSSAEHGRFLSREGLIGDYVW